MITTFLVASTLMFGSILNGSAQQSQALKEQAVVNQHLAGSALNITSATIGTSGSAYVRVSIDNTGSESVFDFSEMDVILKYTDDLDATNLTHLTFNSVSAGVNQWTVPVSGVQPDTFNPNAWDSDEVLTLDIQVTPSIKSGTSANIVVGTPQGVTDQSDLTNP
ncbi:MAG: hypothetical protein HQ475_07115 [SAR202 cluster bacterium]|nr:hypothetical protein [SAR202 cluster bacterium]